MTANMAICRTSIHTSPAANTAQHIPKFRGQHLRTPVIDNNQMKLFRTINVPSFARSCQPEVSYPVKRAPTALRASMVINTSTSANAAIRSIPITAICVLGSVVHIRALPSLVTQIRTGLCHREITAGNTYFSTEEIFADFCRMNKVIASGVSGPS